MTELESFIKKGTVAKGPAARHAPPLAMHEEAAKPHTGVFKELAGFERPGQEALKDIHKIMLRNFTNGERRELRTKLKQLTEGKLSEKEAGEILKKLGMTKTYLNRHKEQLDEALR
jgi:hypothetical protein